MRQKAKVSRVTDLQVSKEGAGDSAKGRNGTDHWNPQHEGVMKRNMKALC